MAIERIGPPPAIDDEEDFHVDRTKRGEPISDGCYETCVWEIDKFDNPDIPPFVKRVSREIAKWLRLEHGWELTHVLAGVFDANGLQQSLGSYLKDGPSTTPPTELKLGFRLTSPAPPLHIVRGGINIRVSVTQHVWEKVDPDRRSDRKYLQLRTSSLKGAPSLEELGNSACSIFAVEEIAISSEPLPVDVFDYSFESDGKALYVSISLDDTASRVRGNARRAMEAWMRFEEGLENSKEVLK